MTGNTSALQGPERSAGLPQAEPNPTNGATHPSVTTFFGITLPKDSLPLQVH